MNILGYPLVLALVTGPPEGAPQALDLGVLRPPSEAIGSACAIHVDVLQRGQHIGNGVGSVEHVPSLGFRPASEKGVEDPCSANRPGSRAGSAGLAGLGRVLRSPAHWR